MNNYTTQDEFDVRFEKLKNHFPYLPEKKDISGFLLLKIRKNWTKAFGNSNSNYQINSGKVKDFFPVLQISDSFPHWRMGLQGEVNRFNFFSLGVSAKSDSKSWLKGEITYRHKIQNSYPYLQLTLEGGLRKLKNAMRENDQLFFLKKYNEAAYFVVGTRDKLFHEKDFITTNPELAKKEKTVFHPVIIDSPKRNRTNFESNIIYYGPPGTGKTRKIQLEHLNGKDNTNAKFITFHQSYSYEEFIEGLKPVLGKGEAEVSYEIAKGVFFESCKSAAKLAGYDSFKACLADSKENRRAKFDQAIVEDQTFVMCIDEINRANISAVFGDLITLVEASKRLGGAEEMTATLPYSKDEFGVPANLQIIGTMNTSDRSITLLDTALRRRFYFEELSPDPTVLKGIEFEGIKLDEMLSKLNNRIRYLLGKDQCIGHSHFIHLKDEVAPKKALLRIFINKLIPLLEEYFYNDFGKIKLVLGEGNKEKDEHKFYRVDNDLDFNALFGNVDDSFLDEETASYVLNDSILNLTKGDEAAIDPAIFINMYQ